MNNLRLFLTLLCLLTLGSVSAQINVADLPGPEEVDIQALYNAMAKFLASSKIRLESIRTKEAFEKDETTKLQDVADLLGSACDAKRPDLNPKMKEAFFQLIQATLNAGFEGCHECLSCRHGICKRMKPYQYKTFYRDDPTGGSSLNWCDCMGGYISPVRFAWATLTALTIAKTFTPGKQLTYTSFASGSLLQDWLVLASLVQLGFNNLKVNFIDTKYRIDRDGNLTSDADFQNAENLRQKLQYLPEKLGLQNDVTLKMNFFKSLQDYLSKGDKASQVVTVVDPIGNPGHSSYKIIMKAFHQLKQEGTAALFVSAELRNIEQRKRVWLEVSVKEGADRALLTRSANISIE